MHYNDVDLDALLDEVENDATRRSWFLTIAVFGGCYVLLGALALYAAHQAMSMLGGW